MNNRTKLMAVRMNIGVQNVITTNYRKGGEKGI